MDRLDRKGLRVRLDPLVQPDRRDPKVLLDLLDQWAPQVRLDRKDLKESPVLSGQLGLRDLRVRLDLLAQPGRRGLKA